MFDLFTLLKKKKEAEEQIIVRLKSPNTRVLHGFVIDVSEEFFTLKSLTIGEEFWEYAIPFHNVSYIKTKSDYIIKAPPGNDTSSLPDLPQVEIEEI